MRPLVQLLVFLHVGEIDQEVERLASEHRVDVRIMVLDLELLRLLARAFGLDVAQAHDLDERRRRQHWQIRTRHAAATNDAGPDALRRHIRGKSGSRAGGQRGAPEHGGFSEIPTAQERR